MKKTHGDFFQEVVIAEFSDDGHATLVIALQAEAFKKLGEGKVINLNHANAPCIPPKHRILVTGFTTDVELIERLKQKGFLPMDAAHRRVDDNQKS